MAIRKYSNHADIPAHVAKYIQDHGNVASADELSIDFINAWFDDKNWEGESYDNPANYTS